MPSPTASATSIFTRTPGVLRALLAGLDQKLTESDYGSSTWSAKEIVAHLIFAERTDWMPRVRHILADGDSRPFEPFDRNGHSSLIQSQTLAGLLDIFEHERSESLRELAGLNLSDDDLQRVGLHPAFGRVTLGNLLATWAVHDLNHIAQIAKAVAFQFKASVGPWEQYLSVLAPPNPR